MLVDATIWCYGGADGGATGRANGDLVLCCANANDIWFPHSTVFPSRKRLLPSKETEKGTDGYHSSRLDMTIWE